jgi:hypothetical protein
MAPWETDAIFAAIRRLPLDDRLRLLALAQDEVAQDTLKPAAVPEVKTPPLLEPIGDESGLVAPVSSTAYEVRRTAGAHAVNESPKPIDQANTPDLALALPALRRAPKRAEVAAIAKHTALIQVENGQVVRVHPDAQGERGSQAKAWTEWTTNGPQGPIDDDKEPEHP